MEHLKKNNKIIQYCDNLSQIDKWKIYCYYLCKQYGLKNWFHITYSKSAPEKGIKFNYLWKDLQTPVYFIDFCSNLKHIYIGDDWDKYGYAQKEWLEYPSNSIYYWMTRDERYKKDEKLWNN